MAGRLDGRVVVITGAGQGIGRGLARRFAREGARIVVAEIDRETGPRTVAEVEELGATAIYVPTDVAVEDDARGCVRAAIAEFGTIDVLVNNAWGGVGPNGRIEWTTSEHLRRAFEVGFFSVFWTMQEAFPTMRAQGRGSIINICSLNGVNAHMFSMPYNTAKEAVRTLSRTAAVEWGRHGIRTNVICPGAATEAWHAMRERFPDMINRLLDENPMRKMGDPEEDIGGAALFLASDDSGYVNGDTLFVGGGTHVNGVAWRMDLPDDPPEGWGHTPAAAR